MSPVPVTSCHISRIANRVEQDQNLPAIFVLLFNGHLSSLRPVRLTFSAEQNPRCRQKDIKLAALHFTEGVHSQAYRSRK